MRVLLTRRWLGIHLGVLLGVLACIGLGWWQFSRAAEGNARSLGYAFEWPTFAIILIVLWIRGMRDVVQGRRKPTPPPARVFDGLYRAGPTREQVIAADEADDPELAAYNARLAALHASDLEKRR